MSKQPLNLLFKNAFRVFGKTKLLASELTLLMLVSTTVLTATSLTNVNLDNSKKLIENNSNPMEFSINEKENESINVNSQLVENSNIAQPKYNYYLNANNNFSPTTTGSTIGSSNSLSWMQDSPNNKLSYYYVTNPDSNGTNLLKIGPNQSSFASILLNDGIDTGSLLDHTGEIFSFIKNPDVNLNAVPQPGQENPSSFDLRQIIYDNNNKTAKGISKFGYAQVLGFDLDNKISMSHNIVDTKNADQFIVQSYKNTSGAYAVPNEVLILLGNQDTTEAKNFYETNACVFPNPIWDFSSFSKILSDVGRSINNIGPVDPASPIVWKPYELAVDTSQNSNKTKFLYNVLTNESNEYKNLRDQINHYFSNDSSYLDFQVTLLNQNDLNNVNQVYQSNDSNKIKSLRYLKTIAYFPPYLNETELNDAIADTKNLWASEIDKFVDKLINPVAPWNNVDGDLTKLLTPISQKVEINFANLNAEKLFNIGKESIEESEGSQAFQVIDKDKFIQIYTNTKNKDDVFNKIFDSKSFLVVNDYVQVLTDYLDYCLNQYLRNNQTVKYFYDENYTLNGILKQLDFDYVREKDFAVSDSISGNSYIVSHYTNNQPLNEIVDDKGNIVTALPNSNNERYYNAMQVFSFLSTVYWQKEQIVWVPGNIPSYDGTYAPTIQEYIAKNLYSPSPLGDDHYYPNYQLFVNFDLLDLLKKMYLDVEWTATPSQIEGILKCLYPFTQILNSQLNEKFYKEEILPLIRDVFYEIAISSVSLTESAININACSILDLVRPAGTPIVGNLVSKSSYAAIVSTDFLNNNKYDAKNNPNGKEIYPDLSAYKNASELPYISYSSSSNSANRFLNPLTGKIEYYRDFDDWFSRIPDRYKIAINGVKFLIVNAGISANFLYPVANEQTLLVNSSKTAVLYMNDAGYSRALINSNGSIQNKHLSLRYVGDNNEFTSWYHKNQNFKKLKKWITENVSTNSYYQVYRVSDSQQPNKLLYTRMTFINNFQKMIIGITMTISLIVLILSLIFICTLIRSIIKQNRQMFGICLANGINKHILAVSFVPFSLIPAIIAGVFGYFFGNLLQPFLNGMISQYWTIPFYNLGWLWWLFIVIPLFLFLLLFLISYVVVVWTLRKSATEILATPSAFRMNALVEHSNWLFKHFKARTAFKFTYIFGNITRFFILTAIVTSFITLSSITVGSINAFDTALVYTQKNKNYNFGFDLYSPTIQGGFYDLKPASWAGTSSDIQPSLYQPTSTQTSYTTPIKCGSINYNQQTLELQLNQQIFSGQKTFGNWLQQSVDPNSSSVVQISGNYWFSVETTKNWLINAPENSQLNADIQQVIGTDVIYVTPKSIKVNNNDLLIQNPPINPMQIVYHYLVPTYDTNVYQPYWTNPYKINGITTYFDTIFYPNFNIVPDIQQNVKFFTGKTWIKTLLDFDIDLGAFSLNPWMFAKSLMPSGIIALGEQRNKALLDRAIAFYQYLDDVANGKVKDNGEINYKKYYEAMDCNNKPYTNEQTCVFNPINIDGSTFEIDAQTQKIVFNKSKSLLIPKVSINNNDDQEYVLNVDIASKGLPTFELVPEAIRMWTYISTNHLNSVYKKWETDVLKVKNENLNYSLGMNTVLYNETVDSNDKQLANNSTYTYLTSILKQQNDKPIRNDNVKIIGINPVANNQNTKPIISLYDSKDPDNQNALLNSLLLEKIDGYYPLIINEVTNKYYKLHIGDVLNVDVTNGLFRFKRYGLNQNPNVSAQFKIVGITSSKSEMQFYTNQKFANEILEFNSTEDGANTMYPTGSVPFNGLFTDSTVPSAIANIAPIYAPLGINPAFPLCAKTKSLERNDNESALMFAWNKLNSIFKFDIINNQQFNKKGLNNVLDRIVNIGNMDSFATTFNCVVSEIVGVDAKVASNIISGTIDQTVANIQLLAIIALLPTLFIIITLMATMIVTESRRLIAIMKVLGFGDWFNTFNFMFVYIIVLFLGLLLAIPITYGLLAGFKALGFGIFNIIINPVAPWWIYLASSGAAAILFVILFIVVKFKMKKINLTQATSFN